MGQWKLEIPFQRLIGRQTNIFNLICCKKQNKKVMVEILKKKKINTNPEWKLTIPGCRERREMRKKQQEIQRQN